MNEEVKEIFKTNKAYKLDDICKKIKTMSKEDIQKEIEELEKSINKRKNLLSNENFVKRAPENIVANEKQKLIEEEEKLFKLKN